MTPTKKIASKVIYCDNTRSEYAKRVTAAIARYARRHNEYASTVRNAPKLRAAAIAEWNAAVEPTFTDTDNTEAGGGAFTLKELEDANGGNMAPEHYDALRALKSGTSVTLDLGAGGLVTYTRVS